MKKNYLFKSSVFILSTILLLGFVSCEQSEPEEVGNERYADTLVFSGRNWTIKNGNGLMGPGPNFFSNHPNDVWVDQNGYLHLTVTERDGQWKSTEVVSQDNLGYGKYAWTLEGNPLDIDENVIIGLFTWDNNTFQEHANSEVDIEFAKWGEVDEGYTLQYGVQPIAFGPYNEERVDKPEVDSTFLVGVSTHEFTWTDTLITWRSYAGEYSDNPGTILASWSFDLNNPARIKYEGDNQSDPIVIPGYGATTNARMNYWLLNGPQGPSNQFRHEIIIRSFNYTAL